jgi:hypothetical protein
MKLRIAFTVLFFCAGSLFASDLKIFVAGNEIGANTIRKATADGKIKCVSLAAKPSDAEAQLAVKTQTIQSPIPGLQENSYSATMTSTSGDVLWSETSTTGLGRIAKSLSKYACSAQKSK